MQRQFPLLIITFILAFDSLISHAQDSVRVYQLTIALSSWQPHMDEDLYFAVKTKSGVELERRKVTPPADSFNVSFNVIIPDSSYIVDFFTDDNDNGRYDVPPTDHAWRITLDRAKGDTVIPFVHNTFFTDIKWTYKLTVNFIHMNPHINQLFKLYLRNNETGAFIDSTVLDPVTVADFSVNLFTIIPGSNYMVDFWADLSGNRTYDVPPADHAWRLQLPDVSGDTILDFTHNTDFTDIGLGVITAIDEIDQSGFRTFPNPAGDELIIRTTQADRNIFALKIFNSAGELIIDHGNPPPGPEVKINVSQLKSGMYILSISNGTNIKQVKFIKQ